MKNIRKFLFNALILCGVSLIMRTVSVSFNVYVSNAAGAEAMGLYSLLSSVYGFAITFATSGINITTVRMVAGALGRGNPARARECLSKCALYSLFFSGLATVFLFFGADFIGRVLLSDVRTVRSLRLLSFTLIPISLASVFSGYFTAVRRVWKNAVIQMAEQAVRIFSVCFLLSLLLPRGVEFACMALALGGAIAECGSCLISLIAFLHDKRRNLGGGTHCENGGAVTKEMLSTALPIAFSAYARSGLISIEHMLIPIGLCKSGSSRQKSLAAYGTLHSMVLPIVLFPSALIGSFSGLLVPELTECSARGNSRQVRYICERVTQLSLLFSIGTAGVMICFSGELGSVIYPNADTSLYIKLLAPLIPIMYIDTTVDSMLKGLGEQFYCMAVNILDSLLSVILVWLVLPRMGIEGYIVTIYITELVNATFSITRLITKSGMIPKLLKWVGKPLLCIVGATCMAHMLFTTVNLEMLPDWLCLTVHITATVILYALLLIGTCALDREDIRWAWSILRKDHIVNGTSHHPTKKSPERLLKGEW